MVTCFQNGVCFTCIHRFVVCFVFFGKWLLHKYAKTVLYVFALLADRDRIIRVYVYTQIMQLVHYMYSKIVWYIPFKYLLYV